MAPATVFTAGDSEPGLSHCGYFGSLVSDKAPAKGLEWWLVYRKNRKLRVAADFLVRNFDSPCNVVFIPDPSGAILT